MDRTILYMYSMQAILINYNYDPEWLWDYNLDTRIYDRSDDGIKREFKATEIYKTQNIGDVDYDKLGYLIENYDSLPDVFLWGKSNLFKYVDGPYFRNALEKREFTPLLKFDHKTYLDGLGVVCRYRARMYEERADSWFFNNPALSRDFHNWNEWTDYFRLPKTSFIPFAPGGNYILTRERVHRYSKDFYSRMRDTLPYAMHPAEAHAAERSYYLLWR